MSRSVRLVATLLAVTTCPLSGQTQTPENTRPLAFHGLSAGRVGSDFFTTSFRWTRLNSAGFGFDGAVTTAPQTFRHGILGLMGSFGPVVSVLVEEGALLVKAGATPIVVFAEGGSAAGVSTYYGGGLIVTMRGSTGLRIDWTRHHVLGDDGGINLFEIGIARSLR